MPQLFANIFSVPSPSGRGLGEGLARESPSYRDIERDDFTQE
jgi:hypothetical protein